MARPKAKAPARRYHISGQSVVNIDGRDYYLGRHDSPESIARYAVLIGIYQKHDLQMPDDFDVKSIDELVGMLVGRIASETVVSQQANLPILVKHLTSLYREHVNGKYHNSPQDRQRHERICDILDALFGDLPANEFGPLKLNQIRDVFIKRGLRPNTDDGDKRMKKLPSRRYVNWLVQKVVKVFVHALSKELISPEKIVQLKSQQFTEQ